MKQLQVQLIRFRNLLSIIIVIGLIGFTTYQISLITGVQVDQDYLSQKEHDAEPIKLRIKTQTLSKLQQLQSAGDTDVPIRTGKTNPFSL